MTDATMARHRRDLERELDRLLALAPTNTEGRHLQASMTGRLAGRSPLAAIRDALAASRRTAAA